MRGALKPITSPKEHVGKICHVEGWNKACQFVLKETDGYNHVLVTPKTKKVYRARGRLLHTQKQSQEMEG